MSTSKASPTQHDAKFHMKRRDFGKMVVGGAASTRCRA